MAKQPGRSTLRVSAFKDWFSNFVVPKEGQSTAPTASGAAIVKPGPPKRDFLEARQVSLYQLFDSEEFKFDIPVYQRPYSWRTKHVFELLQDFLRAYHAKQEYFLGAVVATKNQEGTAVPYQLIDGQQRLTTLVMLLAVLNAWAKEQRNEGLEQRIRRMLYLEADPLNPRSTGRYRLQLRGTDDAFFRANLLDSFLPQRYRLTGVAAAAQAAAAAAAAAAAPPGIAAIAGLRYSVYG